MESLFEREMEELFRVTSREMSTGDILRTLVFTGIMTLIIFAAYKGAHTRQTYQSRFAVTLVVIGFVSTILMDLVQSNLALSLGMLGSLSIVRFRTNIKDPRDIGFVIWSMAAGIAAATQNYVIGIAGCAVIALVMILTRKSETATREMLLIIRGSNADLDRIQAVAERTGGCRIKAKNILSDSFEIVYEMNLRDDESNDVIKNIFELGGIDSVNLLSQNTVI